MKAADSAPETRRLRLRPPLLAAGLFLAGSLVLLWAVLAATGGVFSYALDDAYIHLSMAEQVLRGGYGVNPGEPASASSSILFPLVEAAGMAVGLGAWTPLVLNLLAGAAASALLAELAREGGLVDGRTPLWAAAPGLAFGVLALNLPGLAFQGMEHLLHLALALAALLLVARLERTGRGAWAFAAVLAVSPLVRFEGLAMLGAGVLVLLWTRRFAPAAAALAFAGAGVGLFVWRLESLGLPPLPSSVLAKASDGDHDLIARARRNLATREGLALVALIAIPGTALTWRRGEGGRKLTVLFAAMTMGAHLALGPFGWWNRYEAYVLALGIGLGLLVFGAPLRRWLAADGWWRGLLRGIAVAAVLLATFQEPVTVTLNTPMAARSIRLQQHEMRRFAVGHLRAPVAVNDLGWVSFRNDRYVLDLWGLGSEAARRARREAKGPEWMDALARAHGVKAAMIYDSWVRPPPTWVRVGWLRARVKLVVTPVVSLYATSAAEAPAVRAAAADWARGLPAQDVYTPAPALTPALPPPVPPA